MILRSRAAASKAYNELLSDEQLDACIAAGAKRRTRTRLGQSGPETGQQCWVGKECSEKPSGPKWRIAFRNARCYRGHMKPVLKI